MSFEAFAAAHGLVIRHLEADNRWHRVPTEDKPRKKNGCYIYDGERGAVKNYATMTEFATYRDGVRTGPVDRAAIRARAAIAEAEQRARYSEARKVAEDMLRRAVFDAHPYLEKKGFPQERGLVLDGELLIPMREFKFYKQVNSIQRISADGAKLFLTGGKAKDSVLLLGPSMCRERWLVEGYATALSVRLALRELRRDAQVIVCFSAGNLAHLGPAVKAMKTPAYVFADNDASKAGEQAAISSGLAWGMAPEVGMDANDWQQRYGIRALVKLVREIESAARPQRQSA
jgi:putative DNA primase/helicase